MSMKDGMKKVFSILLCLLMLVQSAPVTVFAQEALSVNVQYGESEKETLSYEASSEDTVGTIKASLQRLVERGTIEIENLDGKVLVFNGTILEEDKTLAYYGVESENTLYLKPAFVITCEAAKNGTVTAKNLACEGETVTLSVTPEDNYLCDSLTVQDASGNPITVAEDNSFKMPGANVKVTATFALIDNGDSGDDTTGTVPKTIYFENTDNWTKVNIFYWGGAEAATWPGEAMTDLGDGIWSYEVPADTVNIIFNNGSTQTNDLTIPTDGSNLYTFSANTWSVYDGNSGGDEGGNDGGSGDAPEIETCDHSGDKLSYAENTIFTCMHDITCSCIHWKYFKTTN